MSKAPNDAFLEIEDDLKSDSILLKENKNEKAKASEELFNSLMPTWMDQGAQLSHLKSPTFLYDKGEEILTKLYDIIEDKTQKLYHHISFTIICQYLDDVSSQSKPSLSVSSVVERNFEAVLRFTNVEYKVKILQIFIVYWKTRKDIYVKFRENVRTFELSEDDSGFFKLAFLLKERKGVEFQMEFEKYLENAKKTHGDYYNIALKPYVRLLSKMADGMPKTETFIFHKFPSIEVNSSIMKNFHDVQDFHVFTSSMENLKDLEKFKKELDHCDIDNRNSMKQMKKRLFSRNLNGDKSFKTIFEQVLSTPGAGELIKLIWNKFELNTHSEILNIKNPHGKLLMEYVIESKDDGNLMAFLTTQITETRDAKFTKNDCYLKMLNNQYLSLTGKTLFEHHVYICANDLKRRYEGLRELTGESYLIIFSLLEEFGELRDIRNEVPIDKLLELAHDEEYYKQVLDDYEVIDNDSDTQVELRKKRYYIDDLMGTIVAYWKPTDPNYEMYKEKLMNLSPFYNMIFNIIEHKDKEFIACFWSDLKPLEESYADRYGEEDTVEHFTTSFLFILLMAAILNNQENIINNILKYESFVSVDIKFPPNIRTNTTCQHVAKKMLEHGHEVGRKEIPPKWMTSNVFKEFLDSRIRYESEELVELDCSFLLHTHTKKYQVTDSKDVDNKLVFWEDTESLEFINESESLKSLLTHPVISTYINLKVLKFKSFYFWNFLTYILLFVVPFGSLIVLHFLTNRDNAFIEFSYIAAKFICPLSVFYLVAHEGIQYYFVDKSFKSYFKKKSNWLEVSLIVTSGLMVIFYVFERVDFFEKYLLTVFSVITILLTTMTFLSMLPSAPMMLHMIMLKKVGKTFIKFFSTFICIVLAFTLSFCVIFGVKADRNDYNQASNQEDIQAASNETFKNFETFPTSLLKVILMLSGEYQLEPYTLNHVNRLIMFYQMLFFLFFVLSTFILFNLILGLAIDDVQKLRENALLLTLKNNVKRISEIKKISLNIYENFELDTENGFDLLSVFEKTLITLFKKCISQYPYLHKIDKIYVNIRTKEVTLNIKGKQENVLTKTIGTHCSKHFIDQEAFDYIKNVIKQ